MQLSRWNRAAIGLFASLLMPVAASAQQGSQNLEAVRVFLDCQAHCDFNHLRREILYVNWVRDRQDADLHLLITSERTGGGGEQYTMKYIGLRGFQGVDDEVVFSTRQGDTSDEVRNQVSQRIGLGLARYAQRGSFADRLRLTFQAPEAGATGPALKPRDPWNLWVFSTGVNLSTNGESRSSSNNYSGQLSARRITEQWKFNASIRGSRSTSRYELGDETLRSRTSRYSMGSALVRSLGDHWSFGLDLRGSRSTVDNYELSVRAAPGIEMNVFPYKESTRRQLVFVYSLGLSYSNYRDTTIFNRLKETRPTQHLAIALEATQPWGLVHASLSGSNYLDDFSKNRVSMFAGLQFRVVRGLNYQVSGFYSRVRDQLSLEKRGATDEEILLRLRQLKTSYYYGINTGLSYTFGSTFNNIVNPRFTSNERN